ncbi:MAG: CRTAC1 family protein [Gemmataceae bacterium]|nr:CRTAC1 family protein [Gemmataceae bacterium]
MKPLLILCLALALSVSVIAPRYLADAGTPAKDYPIVFSDVTRPAGLLEPLAGIMGHGGSWGDFDGDGHIDLYVGGFCDRPDSEYKPAKGPVPNRLFRNLQGGRFEQVKQPPVEFHGRTSGAVFADLDNRGWLDLYVANNTKGKSGKSAEPQRSAQLRRVQLFRNDRGKFVDISDTSGACPKTMRTARNIGVFDYNGDGLLDLFIVEDRFIKGPRSALLRNKGNLQFEDVTKAAGLPEDIYGLGLAVADLNGDGRPDFFVPHSNRLFLGQPGNKYREAVELRDVLSWKPLDGEDWPCGAAFGDLNRDGKLDLVLSIHGKQARNKVFLNMGLKDGIPQFRDITKEVGLGDIVPVRCPHVEIQDFDNDGWPDIYLSAAWLDKDDKVTPLIFRNQGVRDGLPRFVPPQPIKAPMVYYPAGPSGDYDNDGRVDLFLINWFQGNHSRLLHNDSPKRHWLDVRVVGKKMNRMGIGAQVRVTRGGELLGLQEVTTGYGYASGQPAVCHFGVGDVKTVDVEVTLPSGKRVRQPNVAADRVLIVEEP